MGRLLWRGYGSHGGRGPTRLAGWKVWRQAASGSHSALDEANDGATVGRRKGTEEFSPAIITRPFDRNRLAILDATHALLANSTETAGIPVFAPHFATFATKADPIAVLSAQQTNPLRSQIAIREEALATMIGTTLAHAGAVLSYADAHGLASLAIKARVTPVDFDRTRLAQKAVLALAGDHGITAELVESAQALIDNAAKQTAASRTTVAAKRAATERLAAVFRETNSVLEDQLDPLLAPLKTTKPPVPR